MGNLSRTTGTITTAALLAVGLALAAASPASAAIGDITMYEDPEGEVTQPRAIIAGPDGAMWFAQQGAGSVGRTTTTGDTSTYPLPGGHPGNGLTVGADGNLWTAQPAADALVRITPEGSATAFTDLDGEVDLPADVVLGPDGNVWFVSFLNGRVGFVTPSGDITTFQDVQDTLENPTRIAAGPDGNLWVAHGPENVVGQLAKVTPTGDVTEVPIPNDVDRVGDLVAGPDGNIWFTSPVDDRIGRVTPAGVVTMFTDVDVDQPEEVTPGPDGNIWFSSSANDRIGRITPAGAITTFIDPAGDLDRPLGIAAAPGPTGDVWFTSFDADLLGRIEPTQVPDAPAGLAASPGDSVVSLSWTAPTDTGGLPITSYRVLRDGTQVHETADGFASSFTDETVVNGTAYAYEVRAVNDRGESQSATANATPRTVPSAPPSLNATTADQQVNLSWSAPAANGGAAILRYRVYRDGTLVHTTANGTTTSYQDTGLTNRTTYRYEVAAVNLVGTGQRSVARDATPAYRCPSSIPAFDDVPSTHQFFHDVCWMDLEEITTGFPDGTFRPSVAVSRGAMSAFMFRLADAEGYDAPNQPTFDDVATSHQFYDEIEWMAEEHITTGFSDDTYRPASSVSRSAMSAFLYRLAGSPLSSTPSEATFDDVSLSHQFSTEIEWMAAETISTGFSDGTYRPNVAVSRQSMSAFMHRLADDPGVGV